MLGLHILGVRLVIERVKAITCQGIIGHEIHHILVTVALHHIDDIAVGIPRDVGEIAVGGITCLEVDRIARGHIQHTNGHQMGCLSRHRVFLGGRSGNHVSAIIQFRNSNQGIIGHHALVHTVEGQACSLGIPEQTTLDAELVAVNALAIHQVTRAVAGHLTGVAGGIGYIEVIILDKGCCTALLVPLASLCVIVDGLPPFHLARLEIHEHVVLAVPCQHQGLVGIGETGKGHDF